MNRNLWPYAVCLLVGCWGPQDHALFEASNGSAEAGVGASAAAHAGTDSGNGAQANSGAAAGSTTGGTGNGAEASGGSQGLVRAGSTGKGGSEGGVPTIQDCAALEGAVKSELNHHCYRVSTEELTFAAARDACAAAGGYLVTLSDEAENDFVAALHDGEHWIGASDGRTDTMSGVGPYTWVDDEPWSYMNWEEGQPNAFETDCPEQGDDSDCFEHCAFQSDSGDWNDRSCWHTIVSICEWQVTAQVEGEAAAGSPP